ncbi:hypothetical protein BZL30_0463 [Mycobacterium kansasii]|uniref:Uncharacterized protein n=1 Tax=Mycobacterium kansasii TaxID=1768 RepID=A0A1V3XTI2_MYCKA|nr:hypothetical protein BZL30_0463 [Mycobacterium kansasii]
MPDLPAGPGARPAEIAGARQSASASAKPGTWWRVPRRAGRAAIS